MSESEGFLYLIRIREFILLNLFIFKFGLTENKDPFFRINNYETGSELYTYFYVKNAKKYEKLILTILSEYENNKSISYIYGKEYFSINYETIIYLIKKVVGNDLIYEMNINNDIKLNKHKKISIYFDEKHNTNIYNNIVKRVGSFENNYFNRLNYFYNVYCNSVYNKQNILINFVNNNNNNINYNYNKNDLDFLINKYNNIYYKKLNDNDLEILNIENIENIENKDNNFNENDNSINHLENEKIENYKNNNYLDNNENNNHLENEKIENYLDNNENENEENDSYERYLYICHYCVKYKSYKSSDMMRHFRRTNKCKSQSNFSFEKAEILSKNKFLFKINFNFFTNDDILYIINNYHNKINIIKSNFKNNNLINTTSNNTTSNNNTTNNNTTNNNNLVPVSINSYYYDNIYNNVFHNKLNNTYFCANCNKDYANISSLRYHLIKGVCQKRQQVEKILKST